MQMDRGKVNEEAKMETTIIELENALITGTYVNLCNQLVKDAYLENGYIGLGKGYIESK